MSERHHPGPLNLDALPGSRRDFLKLAGFSIAAAMLPGCGRGVAHEAVPFLKKPEDVTPGQSKYYATGCSACDAGCGLLVKVRDGRPIKVEGNDLHPLNQGRTCAVGQASVLGLYDSHRLTRPYAAGRASDWASVDAAISTALSGVADAPGAVRMLTGAGNGPTTRRAIGSFLSGFPQAQHVTMGAGSALLDAYDALYAKRVAPRYRLENALALVAIDADFLGTWFSPVEHAQGYHAARSLKPKSTFCHHTQFESHVSLTGGNADQRVRVAPGELALVVAALAERVAKAKGKSAPWGLAPQSKVPTPVLDEAAKRLVDVPRGRALVLCGLEDATAQRITAYLNNLLGADDLSKSRRTVDLQQPSGQVAANATALSALRRDIDAGSVKALIIAGCNPVFSLPDGKAFGESLKKVDTVICVSERMDETASVAGFVCPPPHFLARWDDAEPVSGLLTLSQPTLAPLGDTRQLAECLATWRGKPVPVYDQLRATWQDTLHARSGAGGTFEAWWHQALHDGFAKVKAVSAMADGFRGSAVGSAPAPAAPGLAVVLYEKVALRDGRHAHNPWLQELPDPITKVSWQNTADFSPTTAAKLGISDGDIVRVTVDKEAVELPALVQPGQADDVVAIAKGYGALGTDRFAKAGPDWIQATPTVEEGGTVGARAEALAHRGRVTVQRTGKTTTLARTQIYDRLEVPKHLAPKGGEKRPMVQETTWGEYRLDPSSGKGHAHPEAELWDEDHPYEGHHWELAIDLASCTGCAACVIACQSENNIPVVGKDELARQREMHWLRIDRYYQGEDDDLRVANQPMMCQQCDHAPCETVCPVLATVHGEEGLNQQVYNRCVGTRYCSNNCPYKVRRFNWFDYAHDDELQNLSLNPDVTVRTRGVMEKCTFCVQRIQETKAAAARDGRRPLHRDEIQTACMQVCPVDAIVFGDGNDPYSSVSRHKRSERSYRALEELNVQPSVHYLRRVRDRKPEESTHHE